MGVDLLPPFCSIDMEETLMSEELITRRLPVLALRGMTVFPNQTVHFDIGRIKSALALEHAMKNDQTLLLMPQKDILEDDRQQKQPLFLSIDEKMLIKLAKDFIENKQQQCLIGITGESASGKTTLVNYVSKAVRKKLFNETYTSLCCDDYYKDTSAELREAGSYEELYKTGFSFDKPEAINLPLVKSAARNLFFASSANCFSRYS